MRGTAKYVVTDGEQIMEVIRVQDMYYELGDRSLQYGHHSEDMLMAYLPRERILLNTDLYSPRRQAPMEPTLGMRTLYENIRKLKFNPERHVPIYGRVATQDEFMAIFSNAGRN